MMRRRRRSGSCIVYEEDGIVEHMPPLFEKWIAPSQSAGIGLLHSIQLRSREREARAAGCTRKALGWHDWRQRRRGGSRKATIKESE